jgi:prevent-host-death family protein
MPARKIPNTLGVSEAKARFPDLLKLVEAGNEFTITKRGVPIARLVPVKKVLSVAERRRAIARLQKISGGLSLGGLKIRDLIEEGRA